MKCWIAILAALVLAGPALAEEPASLDRTISRLRACAVSGAAGAPQESLQAAVVAIRSLCRPQIDAAYRASDAAVDAEGAGLGAEELSRRRQHARHRIDFDLVRLISSATGREP